MRAKATARTAVAIMGAAADLNRRLDEPPRPLAVVVADGLHTLDALARDLKDRIRQAPSGASVEEIDRLVGLLRVTSGLTESAVRLGLIKVAIDARDLEISQQRALVIAMIDTLQSHLGASDEPSLRLWMVRAAQAGLGVLDRHSRDRAPAYEELLCEVRSAIEGVPWTLSLAVVERSELDALRARAKDASAEAAALRARCAALEAELLRRREPLALPPAPRKPEPAGTNREEDLVLVGEVLDEESALPFDAPVTLDVVGRPVPGPYAPAWPSTTAYGGRWRP